jgi:PAS domain S-box-containing protein
VTEHAAMRKEIEESAAKLELASRTAKLGYWHFDEVADEYLDISEEYAAIYGYSVEEFLERFLALDDDMQLVHPEDRESLYEAYNQDQGKVDYNYRILHKDGHWLHVREISVDIQDEAGNYIESLGTLQDITELKEAQVKAERANQAKNDFLSRMSHELRTPLNAILGFSELIESDPRLDERQQSKATAIFNAGQHLLLLVNEILDLSRLEAGSIEISMEPISLEGAIKDSVTLVSDLAHKRGVTIDYNLGTCQGLMIEADLTRLKQVFLNLLSNAVKYNRENGTVTINCAANAGAMVSVGITDSGPGISLDRLDDLFEPFNRLGAEMTETEGTGIGLLITRQLVELMQGELEVESNPGEGSTFTVRFKTAPSNSYPGDSRNFEPGQTQPRGADAEITSPRILVAEDNPVNQAILSEQLLHLGYCADFAANGVEALALWKAGDYPLLLSDIRMPEMDGNELISRVRDLETDTSRRPIVVATASAMESDVQRSLDAGADDIISKPIVIDVLKQVLEKWIPQSPADLAGTVPTTQTEDAAADVAIDLAMLRRSVGDKPEVQRRLLKTYLDALPKALLDIRQAFAWHNLEHLGFIAHRLKSSSSSLGAMRISRLCQTLEQACGEGRDFDIAPLLSQLELAADSVEQFVVTYCDTPLEASRVNAPTQTDDDFTHSNISVLLVDDDPIMHHVTTPVLNDLGVNQVQSAVSGQQALQILAQSTAAVDIIICDLNMPEMDGIEFTRHLAMQNYPGALVLSSGEDIRILRTVEKLAIEHELQVLGVLEKPVTRAKMNRLFAAYDHDETYLTIIPVAEFDANELSRAIGAGEMDTYFQPKIDVKTLQIVGVEALVRWRHPQKGIIGPDAFIPMAEEHNLIHQLTEAVCRKTLQYAAGWQARGIELNVALNISIESLNDLDWPNAIASQVDAAGLQPTAITFEITESRLMEHIRVALDILGRLSLKRFKLSIDDFGTGYSSMEQLQRIPFSELKIDRAFVRGASDDVSARAILESSVLLAKKLDMKVVAEGVETEQDWDLVTELGCDYVQGYYIARPMPDDELCDWLAKQKIKPRS